LKLRTGGKRVPGRQNLWVLTGVAAEVLNDWEGSPCRPGVDKRGIDPARETVILGELGRLGGDGRLHVVLPDGEEKDVTPLVKGLDHYTFDVYPTKHRLWIRANGAICNFDNLLSKPTFCVGQNVTFTSDWEQTPPAIETTTSMWELGGTYVNDHTNAVSGGTMPSSAEIYFWNSALLMNEVLTNNWWISGSFELTASYPVTLEKVLTFSNGQRVVLTAGGLFNMHRPKIEKYNPGNMGAEIQHGANPGTGLLAVAPTAQFTAMIKSKFDGQVGVTQLINGYATNATQWANTFGTNELDKQEFNLGNLFTVQANAFVGDAFWFGDEPHVPLSGNRPEMHWNFEDYIRYKPNGSGSIFVTLAKVTWHAYAASELVLVPDKTYSDYFPLPPPFRGPADPGEAQFDSGLVDDDAFPRWTRILVIHNY